MYKRLANLLLAITIISCVSIQDIRAQSSEEMVTCEEVLEDCAKAADGLINQVRKQEGLIRAQEEVIKVQEKEIKEVEHRGDKYKATSGFLSVMLLVLLL